MFGACESAERGRPADERITVDVGVLPVTGVAPLFLGMNKGFFAEEGLEVEPHMLQAGAVTIPPVVSGEFEFGFSNTTSLIIAISKGLPLQIVTRGSRGGSDPSESFADVLVRADGPIRSPGDLEGRTISVPALASLPTLTVKAALEKHGVDISTIEFTEIPFPEAIPALESGSVDAIFVNEPFSTLGLQAGHRSVLKPIIETAPDYITSGYFTTKTYIAEHPGIVDRFVRAMNRSYKYSASHPAQVRAAVRSYTDIPRNVAQEMTLPDFSPYTDLSTLGLTARLAKRYGYIEKIPDLEDMYYEP